MFLNAKQLKENQLLINHEKIHLKQQLEYLVIPFYILYGTEFLVRLIQYKNWSKGYLNILFEREAYSNKFNLDYLKQRSFWSFLRYLRNHDI